MFLFHFPWKYRDILNSPASIQVRAVASHTPHTPTAGIRVKGFARQMRPSISTRPFAKAKAASPAPFKSPLVT